MARRTSSGTAVRKEAEEMFIQQHSDSAEFLCLDELRRVPVKPGALPRICCASTEDASQTRNGENLEVHAHPHRKFILSFQCTEGSGSPEEECIMARARAKCRDFWNRVDNDEKLTRLIRQGEPVAVKSDKKSGTRTPRTAPHRTDSEKIREGQKQPIEIKYRRLKERARMESQQKATLLLEERSGQRRFKAHPKKNFMIKDLYADDIAESWESNVQAMQEYDEAKKSNSND